MSAVVTASLRDLGFAEFDLGGFLADDPPEFDYLLDGFLEYGELCWLAGRGKAGKSLLALFLIDACLSGAGTFLGRNVRPVDWVAYIDGENRESSVRRRVHLAGMRAETAALIQYLSVRAVDLGSDGGLEALRRITDRPGRGIVVLDSLVALHRADEDKAGEVRRFVDKLRAVFEPAGVTTIGLAHENRSGNLRGSLDWRNAADRVLELVKRDDGARELSIGDVRDGPEDVEPCAFRFMPEMDSMGRDRLLLETIAGTRPERRSEADKLADQIVLLLRGNPTLSKRATARELGTSHDHGTFRAAWTKASRTLASD